jgi:hypothetical protein
VTIFSLDTTGKPSFKTGGPPRSPKSLVGALRTCSTKDINHVASAASSFVGRVTVVIEFHGESWLSKVLKMNVCFKE